MKEGAMKKMSILLIILAFIVLSLPDRSEAIPAFARKYGFNCNMCHTAYTKLNDFGQRYRDNGYQIPGQEGKEKNVLDLSSPIAMRLTLGYDYYDGDAGKASGFNLYGLDFFAAGVLHKNISFLLIYTPRIDEPAGDYTGSREGSNPSQLGGLESVSLIFSNIVQDALNIRVGRFEPSYHAFSSKRSYYLFQPYEIYTLTTPAGSYVFDDNQIGIEATGHFRSGFKYGLGIVNGNGANPDNNSNKDVYLNLSQTFGAGDGQSAGQRLGVFGYYGWQPADTVLQDPMPTGSVEGKNSKPFYRYGVSGSFNYSTLNLQLLYMQGVDDKAFNLINPTKNYEYSGGLFELDYAGLLDNRLVASVLYNWTTSPADYPQNQITASSVLARYYLGDWSAVNVAVHAEFTHRQNGKTEKIKENIFLLALDFAF
jgi:hypothetical protein